MVRLLTKLLRLALRFGKISLLLGIVNAFKLTILARLTNGVVKLWLAQCRCPLFIRGRTSDDTVVEQVFANQEYPVLQGFKPRTIIDAGANCGASVAYFAAYYPEAEIVALEPEGSNIEILKRNLHPLKNVTLISGALWSRKCWLRISQEECAKYAFRVEECNGEGGKSPELIRAYTVDEIVNANRWNQIDLLKLDIEGAELKLFAENVESWLPKVRAIFIELHEDLAPGCGRALFAALRAFDYTVSVSGEHLIIMVGAARRDLCAPRTSMAEKVQLA